MKKALYTAPELRILATESESIMNTFSYDNTGNNGSDGEKGTVIDGNLEGGDEVGSKGNSGWTFDVWE